MGPGHTYALHALPNICTYKRCRRMTQCNDVLACVQELHKTVNIRPCVESSSNTAGACDFVTMRKACFGIAGAWPLMAGMAAIAVLLAAGFTSVTGKHRQHMHVTSCKSPCPLQSRP
jgi:hypothetical protein